MLSKLLFYKLIKDSSGVIHLCNHSLRLNSRSGGMHYFILLLPARPLAGLIVKVDPTPVNLPDFCRGWLLPISLFLYIRYVVQHLRYFLLLASQLCMIWIIYWGLRSVLEGSFGCFVSPTFLEGGTKWYVELEGSLWLTWSAGYVPIF